MTETQGQDPALNASERLIKDQNDALRAAAEALAASTDAQTAMNQTLTDLKEAVQPRRQTRRWARWYRWSR